MRLVSAEEIRAALTWERATNAIAAGHRGARPDVQDILLGDDGFSLFGRGVILPGHGAGMKIAAIHPANATLPEPVPVEHALFAVVDERSKRIAALLDGPELTRWKTAADSALGARYLAREDAGVLLVLGAGPVAMALVDAHLAVRPSIGRVLLWNRTPGRQDAMVAALHAKGVEAMIADDLRGAVAVADVISSATGATEPLICGADLKPGCHVDLVGGFTPQMREADDAVIRRAVIFVDHNDAIETAGDLTQPIAAGVLARSDIRGDLFDLLRRPKPRASDAITLYKNAGGAHIDLLVAEEVLKRLE